MFNFLSKIKLERFSSVIPSSLQLSSTSYQAAVLFPISSRDHLSSSEEVLLVFFCFLPPSCWAESTWNVSSESETPGWLEVSAPLCFVK